MFHLPSTAQRISQKPVLPPRPGLQLIENVTFNPLINFGEQIGHIAVEFQRVPAHLVMPGWPVFQRAGGEIQVGLPMVLAPYAGGRYTGISGPALPQIIQEVRDVLLALRPDLLQGS